MIAHHPPRGEENLTFPQFTLVKASAGSGKTHALTRRYVLFLLSDRVPHNNPGNILAITFSNNAANEMKERILEWLKALVLKERRVTEELVRAVGLDERRLAQRAAMVLDGLLRNYRDFQVRTIDSFMATVLKASAVDLGYDPQFEIIMSLDSVMEYAFDLFLRGVGEETHEARVLEAMIDLLGENRQATASYLWDPSKEILSEIKGIYRKLSARPEEVCLEDPSREMERSRVLLSRALADLEGAIRESGLSIHGGSTWSSVSKAIRTGDLVGLLGKAMKAPPVKKPRSREAVEVYEGILKKWDELRALVAEFNRLHASCYYYPYLRVYDDFLRTLQKMKKQEGAVFIEDVNGMLARYLCADIVPDVYFRLGETIYHYLIDEFQDTSPIQWANLFPLLDNACAQGGSLFAVGDAKQAIYGFREADYRIMKGCERENPFPSALCAIEELGRNFRSRDAVISFGRLVFQERATCDGKYEEALRQSGLDDYTQCAREPEPPGYAEYRLLERNDEDPPERQNIVALIEDLVSRGYPYGDIGILTQRNDDVVTIAAWLNERGIPFLSYSSLDVRHRKVTGEILALFSFLNTPIDDLAFATFLLGDIFRNALRTDGEDENTDRFRALCMSRGSRHGPLYKLFQEAFPVLWGRYFDDLFRLSGYLPLYDLTVHVLNHFSVFAGFGPAQEAAFVKFLEVVSDFETRGKSALSDFLISVEADEEVSWDLAIPESPDAVRVMTIHKAKGLGFPVTIVVLYGQKGTGFGHLVEAGEDGVRLVKVTKEMAAVSDELSAIYQRERLAALVDDLNTLYVALSRAKEELYLVGVKGARDKFPFDILPADGTAMGRKAARVDRTGEAVPMTACLHVGAPPRVLEMSAQPFAELERRRGRFFHRLLLSLERVNGDLTRLDDLMASAAYVEGVDYDPETTRRKVHALVQNPALAPFWGDGWDEIYVEKEYCDTSGELVRMDKVLMAQGRVVVIDYKTGAEGASDDRHAKQVRNYMRILSMVYPGRVIEGVLVYVDDGEVTQVERA